MLRFIILSIVAVAPFATGLAQHEQDHWAFGDHIMLSFAADSVQLDSNAMQAFEGCVSISDPGTGQLLFYSNGDTIWNRAGRVMDGSISWMTGSSWSCVQSTIAVPDPASPDRYYLFRNHEDYGPGSLGIHYSLIDMRGDSGFGTVVRHGLGIAGPTTEALVAAKQCDGQGYWVLCRDLYGADMRVLLVSDTGLVETNGGRGISLLRYGNGVAPPYWPASLKVAPNGRLVAMAPVSDGPMELFRFDPANGILSDPIILDAGRGCAPYLAFSPNSSKLYVSSQSLIQFDVSVYEKSAIQKSRKVVGPFARTMQLRSDGTLYLNLHGYLGRISFPDSSGAACGYDPTWVKLPESILDCGGLPNFVDAVHPCGVVRARFLPGDTLICGGTPLTFLDSSTGPVAARRWRISGDTSVVDSSRDLGPVMFDRPGTYHVSLLVTGSDGFTDADSCTVVVAKRPSVSVNRDTSMCAGDTVTLTATSATPVDWFGDGQKLCSGCSEISVSPSSTTTYVVRVTNDLGCSAFDTAIVTVLPPPSVSTGPDVRICAGDSTPLAATGADTYWWYPAESLSCATCSTPTAAPDASTTYYVIGTNAAGCSALDSVRVEVTAPPRLSIDVPDSICARTSTRLAVHGAEHYAWWPSAALSCADCASPVASPDTSTWFYVEGRDSMGCSTVDSVLVHVDAAPVLSGGGDVQICPGDTLQLTIDGAATYRWIPAIGLSCDTCNSPEAFPTVSTQYVVVGTSARGCQSLDTLNVTVVPERTGTLALAHPSAVRPGSTVGVSVASDVSVQASSLSFVLRHDPASCRVDSVTRSAALSSEWVVSWSSANDSTTTVHLAADASSAISAGPICMVFVRPFLGRSDRTTLSVGSVDVTGDCAALRGASTTIAIDSVCGLDLRLIEPNVGARSIEPPTPNPASKSAVVRFAVPLTAPTWLRLYAADGRMVTTLIDATLDAGEHTLEVDVSDLPSGRYTLVLAQSGWTESTGFVVVHAN